MKSILLRIGSLLGRCWPRSLTNRVFALYGVTLLVFFGAGLGMFIAHQYRTQVEETQRASVMLIEVVAQAVQDSVVIGDYDTVRKTLDRAVQGSVFESSLFIDTKGGRIVVDSRTRSKGTPPAWLVRWAERELYDVNRNITVGGRDYGVLRLKFDARSVASELWGLSVLAVGAGFLSLLLGLGPIHFLLRRWLGGLERLQAFDKALALGTLDTSKLDTAGAPIEVTRVVELFRRTADLVKERERSRRALDNQKFALDQHAIVSITDLDGRITYANDRFCDITGYRREELLGHNHRIINSGLQPAAFFENLWQVITSGQVWRGEICNRNRAGELYWVSATIVPLLDEKGRPEQYIAIRTDITERVRAERALGELNQDLETKILRRTEALEEATQMASLANRAKSDFLSNMSHEMRTPMNSILGMSFLALRASPQPKVREYLRHINDSGKFLLELISNILDFSKIEAGKLDLESVDFSMPSVYTGVVSLLEETARQKGVRIETDLDPALDGTLRGDPLRVRQILLNFVSNAVKFSSQGCITLVGRIVAEDAKGVDFRLEVRDQGIGMTEEQAHHLFQPFHQADASTTRRFGGTGLGLAICRKLAELMGGRVGVTSELGAGSTFWFEARLQRGSGLLVKPSEADDVDFEQRWGQALQGTRILVVDDNPLNQMVASELLRAAGAEVVLAGDGQKALETLAELDVDCVLMDVQMPMMDGLEATRRIRLNPQWTGLPVIAMTANARREDHADCLAAGMDDFVTKPVVPESFYATVSEWIHKSSRVRSGQRPAAVEAEESTRAAVVAPQALRQWDEVELLDPQALGSLTRNNTGMRRQIIDIFESMMDKTVLELAQALDSRDAAQLADLGHKAKSSAASLGAAALSSRCHGLELAMRQPVPDLAQAQTLVEEIRELYPLVRERLRAMRETTD